MGSEETRMPMPGVDEAQDEPISGRETFADRSDAGRQLAARLKPLAEERPVIVALPRGGIPVAREIADALGAPLEILAVRKLGTPHNPEYGIGRDRRGRHLRHRQRGGRSAADPER